MLDVRARFAPCCLSPAHPMGDPSWKINSFRPLGEDLDPKDFLSPHDRIITGKFDLRILGKPEDGSIRDQTKSARKRALGIRRTWLGMGVVQCESGPGNAKIWSLVDDNEAS